MVARAGWPVVKVPVLSKRSVRQLASRSRTPPPFTTTPRRRRQGEPRDDRNRGAQDQGARSRHNEHRNRTPCSSGGPRRSGHHEREHARTTGHSGRPAGRRVPARTRPPTPGGRSRHRCCRQRWSWRAGRMARRHSRPRCARGRPPRRSTGQRLARQRRLVEHGLTQERPVDRHQLARSHQHQVTRNDVVQGDRLQGVAAVTVGRSGARSKSAWRSRCARPAAQPSSVRPLDTMRLITAAARYSPTTSAPTSASRAMTSTPSRR